MIYAKIQTGEQISAKLLSIKFHEYIFSDKLNIFVANEPRTIENVHSVF
jgi:hypothetical protein